MSVCLICCKLKFFGLGLIQTKKQFFQDCISHELEILLFSVAYSRIIEPSPLFFHISLSMNRSSSTSYSKRPDNCSSINPAVSHCSVHQKVTLVIYISTLIHIKVN